MKAFPSQRKRWCVVRLVLSRLTYSLPALLLLLLLLGSFRVSLGVEGTV